MNALAQQDARARFVAVDGSSFVLGDTPFRFVGANAAVMHGRIDRQKFLTTLDEAARDGANVVRIWAFGEAAADAPAWWDDYALRRGREPIEASFVHLDRVLDAARERGLRVILVLGNRWADYGGAPEIARRCGHAPRDRDFSATGLEAFFRCEPCRADYRAHVEQVVSRTNSVNGVRYRDDPTLFAYELINEASAFDARAGDALVAWVEELSGLVRQLDPNHLIAAGHIGYRTRAERRIWARTQALPNIDYADAHLYPESDPRIDSLQMLDRAIRDRTALAHDILGKPLVIGEFGFSRSWKGRTRPRAFEAFLLRALDAGVDGMLAWIYQPWPGDAREHAIYVDGPHMARSLPTREAMRAMAERARDRSPRAALAPTLRSLDEEPLYRASTRVLRMPPARSSWRREGTDRALRLRPRDYLRLEAESFGEARSATHPHLWLSGQSELEYFVPDPPRGVLASVELSVRISAELPGVDDNPRSERTSVIEVFIDTLRVGEIIAPVDDGAGAIVSLTTTEPAILTRLRHAGGHRLSLRAHDPERSRGMSIYGDLVLRLR